VLADLPEQSVPPWEDSDVLSLGGANPTRAGGDSAVAPSSRLTSHEVRPEDWPDVPGYEILGELGRGGMGVVYKARQTALDRVVALKMILAGSQAGARDRARFRAEAHAVARLQHPNIVQIFEVGEYQNAPYFSLEFVNGGSLADRLSNKPVHPHQAAQLVETLARAMHFAHEHGIIHRDLKPANILLQQQGPRSEPSTGAEGSAPPARPGGDGRHPQSRSTDSLRDTTLVPKVTDFGLAKHLGSDVEHTRSGTVVGTPGYMAPEQAQGRTQEVGPATDIYALGVLLYQLLTGRMPFQGDTPMEVLLRVTTQDPVPPSRLVGRVPRDLETICLKCLEKAPRKRYPTAEHLADDLRRFINHEPIQARPLRLWERGLRWVRRRPTTAGLLVGVAMVLLTLAVGWGLSVRSEQRRLAQARTEVRDLLIRGREAADANQHGRARDLVRTALDKIDAQPALADLRVEAARLGEVSQGRLNAVRSYRAFTRQRDEALFLAALAAGGSEKHCLAARARVRQALEPFGVEKGAFTPSPAFIEAEKDEVRRGCYELLLVLAEVVARPLPRQDASQRQANAARALRILEQAPQLGLRTHAYHLHRARYLTQKGDREGAESARRLAARRPPATALDHYLIGAEHYRQGEPDKAVAAFAQALRLQPGHFWAWYYRAMCHIRLNKPASASLALTSCLSQQPRVVWIYLARGFVQGQLGDYQAAEADFKEAQRLLKGSADAETLYMLYNNRAVTRIGQGQQLDVQPSQIVGAPGTGRSTGLSPLRAGRKQAQRLYAQAEGDLREAIRRQPDEYQAYVSLSQVQRLRKRTGEAIESLGKAIARATPLVRRKELGAQTLVLMYRQRSRLHLEARQREAALADLEQAIQFAPSGSALLARSQRERGHLLYRAGRHERALQAYEAALAARPDPETQRWRAQVLVMLKRYREAIIAYDRHLAGARGSVAIYRGRALARLKLGEHHAALGDLTQALGLESGNVPLRVQRGQTYLACRAPEQALRDFEEALRTPGQDAETAQARLGCGLARLSLAQYSEAVADADAAVRLAPTNARLTYDAACLWAQAAGQVKQETAPRAGPRARRAPQESSARARELRARYQRRALELLRKSLLLLPTKERSDFWTRTVRRDPSLRPIRLTAGFLALERTFAKEA
jgi:serine/threonine protein kinase/tetratricopeptide (TPR) repeat protein